MEAKKQQQQQKEKNNEKRHVPFRKLLFCKVDKALLRFISLFFRKLKCTVKTPSGEGLALETSAFESFNGG